MKKIQVIVVLIVLNSCGLSFNSIHAVTIQPNIKSTTLITNEVFTANLNINGQENVEIKGNTFFNISGAPAVGISIVNSNNITIQENSFSNFTSSSQVVHITISNSNNIMVRNNEFEQGYTSVEVIMFNAYNSTNVTITDNLINGTNIQDGKLFVGQLTSHSNILNNDFNIMGNMTINLLTCHDMVIAGNVGEGGIQEQFLRVVSSHDLDINHNDFNLHYHESNKTIIQVRDTSDAILYNNSFTINRESVFLSLLSNVNTTVINNYMNSEFQMRITAQHNVNTSYYDNFRESDRLQEIRLSFDETYKTIKPYDSISTYRISMRGGDYSIYTVIDKIYDLVYAQGTFNQSLELNITLPSKEMIGLVLQLEDNNDNIIVLDVVITLELVTVSELDNEGSKSDSIEILYLILGLVSLAAGIVIAYKLYNYLEYKLYPSKRQNQKRVENLEEGNE